MQGDERITPRVKELFTEYGVRRTFEAGEIFQEKGARADRLFFLVKGQARTFCLGPAGDEISLFYLGPDNLVGNEALMPRARVMVSVAAITAVEAYTLPPERFLRLWQDKGLPLQELLTHYVQRIALLSDYICCAHFQEADQRVAYFLYACCDGSGTDVRYTHEQIAAVTGTSRVTVSRILSRFRRAGIIAQDYRRIRVLDARRLSEVFSSLGYFLD